MSSAFSLYSSFSPYTLYRMSEVISQHPEFFSSQAIGKRLAAIRKNRGFTQKELAEKINIAWTLISDYERGKLRLNDQVLIKLAFALEASVDQLLGLDEIPAEPQHKPSLRIMRRVKKIESLSPGEQKALLKNIDMFLKGAMGNKETFE